MEKKRKNELRRFIEPCLAIMLLFIPIIGLIFSFNIQDPYLFGVFLGLCMFFYFLAGISIGKYLHEDGGG